jgi:hypothetical protein
VLKQLPKVSAAQETAGSATGFLELSSTPTPITFTPSLTAGGTVTSSFSGRLGTAATVAYK